MRLYDLVVFDWDGTLMDSTASIVRAIRQAAIDLDIDPPADRLAREIIGLGLIEALTRLFPALPESRYQELVTRYRTHYLSMAQDIPLFDGVEDLLADLRGAGCLLAVATGKSRQGLAHALEQVGLLAWFDGTRCADQTHSKPHPAMLLELMDEMGVPADRTVMVGDTTHDLHMARNAGVSALAVTSGAHPAEDLLALNPLGHAVSVAGIRPWLMLEA